MSSLDAGVDNTHMDTHSLLYPVRYALEKAHYVLFESALMSQDDRRMVRTAVLLAT